MEFLLFKGFNLTELSEFDYVVQGAQPREGEREREREREREGERVYVYVIVHVCVGGGECLRV